MATLGDAAWTILLFLLAVVGTALIDLLDRIIPNPSFAGWHPLGFIHGGFSALREDTISLSRSSWYRLKDIFNIYTSSWTTFLDGLYHALVHVGDGVSWVAHTVVVDARNAAESYAHGLTAGEQGRAQDAERHNATAAAAAAAAAAVIAHQLDETNAWGQHALTHATHDDAVGSANTHADHAVANLTADMMNRLSNVWSSIDSLQTAVSSTIPAELAQQAATENAAIKAAKQDVLSKLVNADQALSSQIRAVDARLSKAIGDAESAAATQAAADLSTAEGYAKAQAAADAHSVATADATSLAQAKALLQSQLTTAQGQIATLTTGEQVTTAVIGPTTALGGLTITAAIGALATSVASITTELDQCMVSTCDDTSPNNIRNVLRTLLSALTDATEIGFLAEAIKDPTGTANLIAPVLDTIHQTAADTWDQLLAL